MQRKANSQGTRGGFAALVLTGAGPDGNLDRPRHDPARPRLHVAGGVDIDAFVFR
jgi:hypothetical protein